MTNDTKSQLVVGNKCLGNNYLVDYSTTLLGIGSTTGGGGQTRVLALELGLVHPQINNL